MKRPNRDCLILGLILAMAIGLRVWRLGYDLPYPEHPDEPGNIGTVLSMLHSGDWNPHFFNYPSLFFYIHLLAYWPYFWVGHALGAFRTPQDILPPISLALGVTSAPIPTAVLLGRLVTTTFSVATVAVTHVTGRALTGRNWGGLLASLWVAIALPNVYHSRWVTPDALVTFFALTAFYLAYRSYRDGHTWQYLAAGLFIGFTASTKYTAGIIALSLVAAHLLRYGRSAWKQPQLLWGGAFALVGFLATTPFSLLDSAKFLADVHAEATHYSTGHAGMEGDALSYYISLLWTIGGITAIMSVLEAARGWAFRSRGTILLSTFPIAYFGLISSFIVRNDRTLLPLTPFMFLLAAVIVVSITDGLMARCAEERVRLIRFSVVAFVVVVSLPIFMEMFMIIAATTSPGGRDAARIWLPENLPLGSKVAIESYAPYIDPIAYRVGSMAEMIDHTPEWYRDEGFNYLVLSERMFGRFYADPGRYAGQIAMYNALFDRFVLMHRFEDGYEIRIYKVQ